MPWPLGCLPTFRAQQQQRPGGGGGAGSGPGRGRGKKSRARQPGLFEVQDVTPPRRSLGIHALPPVGAGRGGPAGACWAEPFLQT